MNSPTPSRKIVLGIATLAIVVTLTSHTLNAKKPPKPPPPDPPPVPVEYDIKWLDGLATNVVDVNARGEFVGSDGGDAIYGHIDTNGVPRIDGELELAEVIGINFAGRMAGHFLDTNGFQRVFVYDLRGPTSGVQVIPEELQQQLVDHDGEEAMALDEDGNVVVQISIPGPDSVDYQVLVWSPDIGSVTPLPELGPTYVYVTGINALGEIVGKLGWAGPMFYYDSASGDLEELGRTTNPSYGKPDINDSQTIVGTVFARGSRIYTATCDVLDFVWDELPSKYSSYSIGVNEAGQICGGAERFKRSYLPWTVFVDDPVDGYWLVDELVVNGIPSNVDRWLSGEGVDNDNVPEAISDPVGDTGYGFIVGHRELGSSQGGAVVETVGFVLTPRIPED